MSFVADVAYQRLKALSQMSHEEIHERYADNALVKSARVSSIVLWKREKSLLKHQLKRELKKDK